MNAIRNTRMKLGLSQKDLARRAGIDARTLRKIENGEHVSELSLTAVEHILGISTTPRAPSKARPSTRAFPWRRSLVIMAVLAAILIIGYAGSFYFEAAIHLMIAAVACATVFGLLTLFTYFMGREIRNTRIEIVADSSAIDGSDDILERLKAWLGRDELCMTSLKVSGSQAQATLVADCEISEYIPLSRHLEALGLKVTFTRVHAW